MKKILLLLSFVIVAAMGESKHEINEQEMTKQLSQKERFEMLFGNTTLQFNEVRPSRTVRKVRQERVLFSRRTRIRGEMLFRNRDLQTRIARATRSIFPRQTRHNVYVTLNLPL